MSYHCLWFYIRTPPSKARAVAAAVNRPLPHYKLGDLGIVPRSHPKLGERTGASSPLAPISKQTRSIGVQTVSAQKVRVKHISCTSVEVLVFIIPVNLMLGSIQMKVDTGGFYPHC